MRIEKMVTTKVLPTASSYLTIKALQSQCVLLDSYTGQNFDYWFYLLIYWEVAHGKWLYFVPRRAKRTVLTCSCSFLLQEQCGIISSTYLFFIGLCLVCWRLFWIVVDLDFLLVEVLFHGIAFLLLPIGLYGLKKWRTFHNQVVLMMVISWAMAFKF